MTLGLKQSPPQLPIVSNTCSFILKRQNTNFLPVNVQPECSRMSEYYLLTSHEVSEYKYHCMQLEFRPDKLIDHAIKLDSIFTVRTV